MMPRPLPSAVPVDASFLLRHYLASTAMKYAVILSLDGEDRNGKYDSGIFEYAHSFLSDYTDLNSFNSFPAWAILSFDDENAAIEFCSSVPNNEPYAMVWARADAVRWPVLGGDQLGYFVHTNS